MTKVQALRKLMDDNGGVASWKYIYDNVERYYPAAKVSNKWKEGLRGVLYREIKQGRNFKRIGLGIYCVIEYEEKEVIESIQKDKVRLHSYMEGLLVQLGNYEKYDTYCADPTANFQPNVPINHLTTVNDFPEFSYPTINSIAKRIDVIWFTKEGYKFPRKVIEVVDSIGTLGDSLNRMYQLKEFYADFVVVTPEQFVDKVKRSLNREPYLVHQKRFSVRPYDDVVNYYNKRLEVEKLKI